MDNEALPSREGRIRSQREAGDRIWDACMPISRLGYTLRGARMTERPNIAADLPYARGVPGCRIQ